MQRLKSQYNLRRVQLRLLLGKASPSLEEVVKLPSGTVFEKEEDLVFGLEGGVEGNEEGTSRNADQNVSLVLDLLFYFLLPDQLFFNYFQSKVLFFFFQADQNHLRERPLPNHADRVEVV